MVGASSIEIVLEAYRPERSALIGLLEGLGSDDWERSTDCPAYTVKGVATHILGDDFSLLSRQRDGAEPELWSLRRDHPDADFRTLLNSFNDRWVATARFLSTNLLIELLRLAGEWTAQYYEMVDPRAPGESVGLFGARQEESSPFWQAIAREYLERWIHHSQIRRALGLTSLADRQFLMPGIEVVGAIARMETGVPETHDGAWALGAVTLGSAEQTAAILTRAYTSEELGALATGPSEVVRLLAAGLGR
jgi:uncharacterized protein (TIGR03083 family)